MRALLLTMALLLTGCFHSDGRAFTGPEVYKLGRDTAVAACAVVDGALGDMVAVQGLQLPVAVARAACVLIRLSPEAIGVVVDRNGNGHAVAPKVVRVWIGPPSDWDGGHRAEIGAALAHCGAAFGRDFIFMAHAEDSDLTIRTWDSNGNFAAGRYFASQRLIQIDPARCSGYGEFRTVVCHEAGHSLGMMHIDRHPGEHGFDSSPVGMGVAIMNRHTSYREDSATDPDGISVRFTVETPTPLDMAELRRVDGALTGR